MRDTFFYFGAIAFCVGISVAELSHFETAYLLLCALVMLGACGLYVLKRHTHFIFLALILFMLICGTGRMMLADRFAPHDLDQFVGRDLTVVGVVSLEPERRESNTHLTVHVETVEGEKTQGTVLAYDSRFSDVSYGDRIVLQGALMTPAPFDTSYGRSFDYPGYLRARGVDQTMIYPKIQIESHDNGWRVFSYLFVLKHALSGAIDHAILTPASGLALGLLLGEKQALGSDLLEYFRIAGLIHIVVLSGYNISIMIEAVMRLLSVVSLRLRTVLAVACIVCFVIMVGPSATVLRAALMAGLVLLAKLTGRTYLILRALTVAGMLMLIYNPYLLANDPGFQLSFLATLGLILVAPVVESWFIKVPDWYELKGFAIATIATQLTTLPVIAYSMGAVSTVALFANVLVLPLVPLAMLLSAVTGFVGMIAPGVALIVGYPAYLLLTWMIRVSETFGSIPHASIALPPFPFVLVIFLYGLVAGFLWWWYTRSKLEPVTLTTVSLEGWVIVEEVVSDTPTHTALPQEGRKDDTTSFFR